MRFPTFAKQQIHRPIVPLRLYGLSGRWVNMDVLVDTGSDMCLFPDSLAQRLDLDLTGLPETPLTSALGTAATYRAQSLWLELQQYPERLRWKTTVGFLPRRMTYGLLGTKGFFEHFSLHYAANQHTFDLLPSESLPT